MEIEYLTRLAKNPKKYPDYPEYNFQDNKPISMEEILDLELKFNQGRPFPKALRELLYLAGKQCYCLLFNMLDDDGEMPEQRYQEFVQRQTRIELKRYNVHIDRPFYVIDSRDGTSVRMVYLDEGDDPMVYFVEIHKEPSSIFQPRNKTLTQLINHVLYHTDRVPYDVDVERKKQQKQKKSISSVGKFYQSLKNIFK
jgi:hypothetical protein